jgi:hypothetical protein
MTPIRFGEAGSRRVTVDFPSLVIGVLYGECIQYGLSESVRKKSRSGSHRIGGTTLI